MKTRTIEELQREHDALLQLLTDEQEAHKLTATALRQVASSSDVAESYRVERNQAVKHLKSILWYMVNVYDDKPHQFWNQLRLAAETLQDAEAVAIADDYMTNRCPFNRRSRP